MVRPFSSYLIYFAFAYVGMLILFTIISMFISSAGSSGSIVAPFLAAMIIGEFFIKKENRAPNNAERKALTWGSFLIFLAINIALVALAYIGGAFGDISVGGNGVGTLVLIVAALMTLLCVAVFFMMRWAYGGLTRKRAVKLLGKQTDTFD